MIRLGVTGTDTGVGKTVVAAALLALLRRRGMRVAGMKPVETGVAPGDPASDAALLRTAAGGYDLPEEVCPLTLPEPLAPWVAARRTGTDVDIDVLDAAFDRLCEGRDAIVVEGAGGLLVPLTRDLAFDGLFRRWRLGLIVVAGNRLGVLNHALLTVRAARAAGLEVQGIVLNSLLPGEAGTVERTNADAVAELFQNLPVLPFPCLPRPHDIDVLAEAAESAGLDALIHAARKSPRTDRNL